jgi:hypothetical protein
VAKLAFRATKLEIRRPQYIDSTQHPNWLGLNIVQLHEIDTLRGVRCPSSTRRRGSFRRYPAHARARGPPEPTVNRVSVN